MKTIATITGIGVIGMTVIQIVATPETMKAIMNPAAIGIMTGMDARLSGETTGAIITESSSD